MAQNQAKWRAVLVGCGGISRAWLNALQGRTDVEIVGMVDLVPELAEARRQEFALGDVPMPTPWNAPVNDTHAATRSSAAMMSSTVT